MINHFCEEGYSNLFHIISNYSIILKLKTNILINIYI